VETEEQDIFGHITEIDMAVVEGVLVTLEVPILALKIRPEDQVAAAMVVLLTELQELLRWV
jgi:hypothetical protein